MEVWHRTSRWHRINQHMLRRMTKRLAEDAVAVPYRGRRLTDEYRLLMDPHVRPWDYVFGARKPGRSVTRTSLLRTSTTHSRSWDVVQLSLSCRKKTGGCSRGRRMNGEQTVPQRLVGQTIFWFNFLYCSPDLLGGSCPGSTGDWFPFFIYLFIKYLCFYMFVLLHSMAWIEEVACL